MGRRGYPPEFRRKVLDLVEAGTQDRRGRCTTWNQRPVDLLVAAARPHRPGSRAGPDQRRDRPSWSRPRKRIAELETELSGAPRATELFEGGAAQKAVRGHRGDGRRGSPRAGRLPGPRRLGVRVTTRGAVRPPSERAIRHAWLTDLIREVHVAPAAPTAIARVHAELTLGRGISVGHSRSSC